MLKGTGALPSLELAELAKKYGVTTQYTNWKGQLTRVSAPTVKAVLAALGADSTTPQAITAELSGVDDRAWLRPLPPATVIRAGAENSVAVTLPHGARAEVWIDLDDDPLLGGTGGQLGVAALTGDGPDQRVVDGRGLVRKMVDLPPDLPLGWHHLNLRIRPGGDVNGGAAAGVAGGAASGAAGGVTGGPADGGPGGDVNGGGGGDVAEQTARAWLIVCPDRLELPAELRQRSVWGPMVQLYSVRSHQSWGTGDLADLADLGYKMASSNGAGFVLINPIHAAEPVPPYTESPYLPSTRDFTNPFYIRPEQIAEYATGSPEVRAQVDALAGRARAANADPISLDRDKLWPVKRAALEILYQVPRGPARQADLDKFRADHQPAIGDFALWSALKDQGMEQRISYGTPEAAKFAADQASRVDFHIWLQWIADQQLAQAQARCREGGMTIGIVKDLAVGVHPRGADAWSRQSLLALGIEVGAPPDYFNQVGQGWSEPPWRPDALEATGYTPYRAMLRAQLAHAGALRIDHILGLMRLWWIPRGHGPADGTYVAYDREAMVSILVLEATRAGAVVVGEDLGVVPPGLRQYLGGRGLLGNSIVWFEKTADGYGPLPPDEYRYLAMTAITTHDLPPTSAYLAGEHVVQRDRLGMLDTPLAEAREAAAAERGEMVDALIGRGLLDPSKRHDELEIVKAMHRFLLATPSVMLGVSLADLAGERRTQNLPGTDREYPNWSVPLADADGNVVYLEDIERWPAFRAITQVLRSA
ncbi:MAG: 4-alpha-glucanotransferase [Bifidobacteriaceae bacterium]|nr:4-alpha-glucanotransferase [Bifidobacteriaceae bacterium]